MKTLLYCAFLALALSCKKNDSDLVNPKRDTVLAEYPDWYTIKAPVDKEITGVWGDRDKTLLITTLFAVYRSVDKGNNWQEVIPHQSGGIVGFFQNGDTLFTMSGLLGQTKGAIYQQSMVHASNYSLDDGKTWQSYKGRNPILRNLPTSLDVDKRLIINPMITSDGTQYKINRVFSGGPTATSGRFKDPGVITNTGRQIDLPQSHILQRLYLDGRERLYVVGTDAICGESSSGMNVVYCNSKQGRGVIYVSKRPLP